MENLGTALLIRLFFSLLGILFIIKISTPLVLEIIEKLTNRRKSTSGNSFDSLIARKKDELKMNNSLLERSNFEGQQFAQDSSEKKKASKTEETYIQQVKKESDSSTRKDLGDVLQIFDNLQWGDGVFFQDVSRKVFAKTGIEVTVTEIVQLFKMFLNEDIIIFLNREQLATIDEIKKIVQLAMIYTLLKKECTIENGTLIKKLSSKFKVEPESIQNSFQHLLLRSEMPEDEKIYTAVLTSKKFVADINLKDILFEKDRKSFKSREEFLLQLKKQSEVYNIISPLPNLKEKNDINTASKILGVTTTTPLEEVQQKYKTLVKKRHPDKLISLKLPAKYDQDINNNFRKIKESYELIKKIKS